MNVFLDTEFTDLLDPILISLGMVTENSDVDPDLLALNIQGVITEEFYIEVPYPDNKCTPFVRDGVLPLLKREPDAFCALDYVRLRILNWLQIVRRSGEDIEICIDYEADWQLFCHALDDQVPHWVHRKMIGQDISGLLQYDFFRRSRLPEHHALYDAVARSSSRMACTENARAIRRTYRRCHAYGALNAISSAQIPRALGDGSLRERTARTPI